MESVLLTLRLCCTPSMRKESSLAARALSNSITTLDVEGSSMGRKARLYGLIGQICTAAMAVCTCAAPCCFAYPVEPVAVHTTMPSPTTVVKRNPSTVSRQYVEDGSGARCTMSSLIAARRNTGAPCNATAASPDFVCRPVACVVVPLVHDSRAVSWGLRAVCG